MQGGFILPRFAQQAITLGGEGFGSLAQTPCFIGKTLFERGGLFDAASLWHGAAPFHERKAGAQPAFSSPIKATVRAVMGQAYAC
jgi:hypothetical protein